MHSIRWQNGIKAKFVIYNDADGKNRQHKKIVLEFSNTEKCCNFATQTIMKM
jgi:hypothetical protein